MSEDGKALRSDRRKCYQARDSYFSCTDALIDSGKSEKEAEKACAAHRKAYEADCPSSWVAHFIRKHNFERYKAQLIEQGNSPILRAAAAARPPSDRGSVASPAARGKMRFKAITGVKWAERPSPEVAATPAAPPRSQQQLLQQLWELNKETCEGEQALAKREVQELKEGGLSNKSNRWGWSVVERLRENLEFASIEKLLTMDPRFELEEGKVPDAKLVTEVIWAAVLAKSLGSLAPSILAWIEEAVLRIPEPIPVQKESMIWLLSILRGDLPMLQRLQQESSSNGGRIGPEIERYKTLRYAALFYLGAGKMDEFRSLWTSSGTHLLAEEIQLDLQQPAALLHHALLRNSGGKKKDNPAMLRWYAESLVSYQRTPIPMEPQFETMMEPVIKALGGKIEKWSEDDWRKKALRKWRDGYDDAELDKLVHSMIDYICRQVDLKAHGSREDLSRLEDMLSRLNSEKRQPTVIIDWLNFVIYKPQSRRQLNNCFPSYQLVIVGREKMDNDDRTPKSPVESERIKVMEVTSKREKHQEVDDFCSMVLAVATRGYFLSNDKIRPHIDLFRKFLKDESRDVTQATLLKNYLNDAVLRHNPYIPVVDHSKAAQWIDNGKKELAFTVARKKKRNPDSPFREIEYYSLHID